MRDERIYLLCADYLHSSALIHVNTHIPDHPTPNMREYRKALDHSIHSPEIPAPATVEDPLLDFVTARPLHNFASHPLYEPNPISIKIEPRNELETSLRRCSLLLWLSPWVGRIGRACAIYRNGGAAKR